VRPATGYGWSKAQPARPSAPKHRPKGRAAPRSKKNLTEVWQPGFEAQPEGSTFFVNLSRKSEVEVKKGEDRLVYVIKGARAALRNNRNPLKTTFFATPVSVARLVQVKDDVELILNLKRPASAKWVFAPAGELMQLRISFRSERPQAQPEPSSGLRYLDEDEKTKEADGDEGAKDVKPGEDAKPTEDAKPGEDKKPTEDAKPGEDKKPADETKDAEGGDAPSRN
jgi:hypothetical protein